MILTPPATVSALEEVGTVFLTSKCHPLEHSNLRRVLRRIEKFTLARFHSIAEIRDLVHGV